MAKLGIELTAVGGVGPAAGESLTIDRDEIELVRAGKKQVLKRRFGLLSMTGFSCLLTITWESVLVNAVLGLTNGGPAGLVYSYLVAFFGTLSVFISLSELASMLPTAGGQYHWASVLAPQPLRKYLSYITGWATVVSWVAATTANVFFTATLFQAVVALNVSSYNPQGWQATLIMFGVIAVSTLATTRLGTILPAIEIMLLLLHVLGFIGTIIPLLYYVGESPGGNKQAHEIFTTFFNLGGWSTQTLSFLIGIQGNAAALLGTDGAIHMSEEVEKSTVNTPLAIIYSIIINGVLGFAMLLALLFSVDNFQDLAKSTSTYPAIDILVNSFNNIAGVSTIIALIVFMSWAGSLASLSSTSRMIWSFARDYGLPGSHWLKKVDKRTSIPFNTVYVTATCAALLGLINIGSSTVLQDIISLILEGFYTSYLAACAVLLYRRMRHDIADFEQSPLSATNTDGILQENEKPYMWGPWRVKGWLGTLNNAFAVIYLIFVGFFSFWPAEAQVTAKNMNYSSAVLGGVMVLSLAWYLIRGRKHFNGPVVEVHLVRRHDNDVVIL